MEDENIIQDIEILNTSDSILDSPLDNEVTEEITGEEVFDEEIIEEESTEIDESNKADTTSTEELQQIINQIQNENSENQIDYTENLIAIGEHLQLVSARIEYCNCLLIIILLIILLRYVYKFFKMFF